MLDKVKKKLEKLSLQGIGDKIASGVEKLAPKEGTFRQVIDRVRQKDVVGAGEIVLKTVEDLKGKWTEARSSFEDLTGISSLGPELVIDTVRSTVGWVKEKWSDLDNKQKFRAGRAILFFGLAAAALYTGNAPVAANFFGRAVGDALTLFESAGGVPEEFPSEFTGQEYQFDFGKADEIMNDPDNQEWQNVQNEANFFVDEVFEGT